jgi:hypothetical protein
LPPAGAESTYVPLLIRKITLAALMATVVAGTLALPASASASPVAHASKCKKKKHKRSAQSAKKKKKKCGRAGPSGSALPGQATHPNTTTQSPAPTVADIGVTSSPVLDGDSTTGQVTISGPAPSGGQPVTLQSDTARATVPGSVVVPAGQTTATFPVGTTKGPSATATLTASIGTSSDQVQLSIVSDPSVTSVSLERHCLAANDSFTANRVTLDVPAPVDTPVSLSSDNAALSVPSSTVVPAGSKTALFATTADTPSPDPATAVVTASLNLSSAMDTATVSSTTPNPAVSGVSLQPNTVSVNGTSFGTVTLDCEAGSSGTTVNLSSLQPSIANPHDLTVTVPAGQLSSPPFTVDAFSTIGTADIVATTGTGGSQQATLSVTSLPE